LAPAVPTACTAAPAAFALWTRFVYHERAAEKFLTVQRGDCLFGFRIVMNFGETKTTRLAGETVAKQRQRVRLHSDFCKQRLHLLFCSLERKIAHVQFLHGSAPCALKRGTTARLKRQDQDRGQPTVKRPLRTEASAPATQEHLAASAPCSQPSQFDGTVQHAKGTHHSS
jgi:hypothetical protein